MNQRLVIDTSSYKIGVDEIYGLNDAMLEAMKPVQALVKDKIYWNDCELEPTEYKSRSGFIPYKHNCGGVELCIVIPHCESYGFAFLEFGECDVCNTPECVNDAGEPIQCGYEGMECASESDGHLDAKLRIWLKFEGYDLNSGELSFYLYAGGGNGDAPYFRTDHETTIFDASFTCKSPAGLKRASSKAIKQLLKVIGG